jgi:hypothetical protein
MPQRQLYTYLSNINIIGNNKPLLVQVEQININNSIEVEDSVNLINFNKKRWKIQKEAIILTLYVGY